MKTIKVINLKTLVLMISLILVLGLLSNAHAYTSKTSKKNSVIVDVLPEELAKGQPVKFKVRMNTHSVELTQDMVAVSELTDDQGKRYRPVKWDGAPAGGHHRTGILEFPKLEGDPKSVTLIIRDIAEVPGWVFGWILNK